MGAKPPYPYQRLCLWTPAGNSFPAPFCRFSDTPEKGYQRSADEGGSGEGVPQAGCRGGAPAGSLRVKPSQRLPHCPQELGWEVAVFGVRLGSTPRRRG